jgi:DNA-binding CsgD family transcriptional regulator
VKLKFQKLKSLTLFIIPGITLVPVMLLILLLSGMIPSEKDRIKTALLRETHQLAEDVEKEFGRISINALRFSENLSRSLEARMQEMGLAKSAALSGNKDALEKLQNSQLDILLAALERSGSSGVFMILDATVNPGLADAEYSRSGILLENTEPYMPSLNTPIMYLRGFPSLAQANNLNFSSRWDLEFSVRNRDYYWKPLEAFRQNTGLPLSRLYHWSLESGDGYLGEAAAYCSVPLIDSKGSILGICGFTVSALNFRLQHNPNLDDFISPAAILADPDHAGKIAATTSLLSGDPAVYREIQKGETLSLQSEGGGFALASGRNVLLGETEKLKLYRDGSPFIDENFTLFAGIPKAEADRVIFARNMRLILILSVFLVAGALLSAFIIIRYRSQLHAGLSEKIRIDFEKCRISPRERDVCLLLLQGRTIRQIGLELYISYDTVKSHCRSIYDKLGISSRSELFLKYTVET